MIVLIAYITLVVIYMIACILDGPDLESFRRNWIVSDKWRYAHYECMGNERNTAFHIHIGRWRALEDPNIVKDKVNILPYLHYYYNTSEFYIGFGWLTVEVYFFTHNHKKYRKMMERRFAESR